MLHEMEALKCILVPIHWKTLNMIYAVDIKIITTERKPLQSPLEQGNEPNFQHRNDLLFLGLSFL